MSIVSLKPERIKASESSNDINIDETATELPGLREFVVESYDVDDTRQESRFYCHIQLDYAVCPRCRCVSGDIHQHKTRHVRDMSCFERRVYLVFDIRRFRCPECHKVFTESLDSIVCNRRHTRRFEEMVYQECMGQTFQQVAKKLGMNWHTVERLFYQKAHEQFQVNAMHYPQILGIDEIANDRISFKKGHKEYLLVISSIFISQDPLTPSYLVFNAQSIYRNGIMHHL